MSNNDNERTITLTDRDGCNYVQVSSNAAEIEREINGPSTMDFLNDPKNGGGVTIGSDFETRGHGCQFADGRAPLAPGQLETRSLTGLPRGGDASRLDPEKTLIEVNGIEMTLEAAINAGVAQIVGGQVRERQVEGHQTKAAPIRGAYLGDQWEAHRKNGDPDAHFSSVMAAVSRNVEGAELDSVLRRFNEALNLGLNTSKEVGEVYNVGLDRLKTSMTKTLEQAMPTLKGEGREILEHYIEKLNPETRTSICQRALYGDASWVPQLKGLIERDIRQAVFFKRNIS